MPLVALIAVFDVVLIIHAARTGRFSPCAYVILALPGVGGVAYILVELLPEWMQPVTYLFRLFETFGTYVKHDILDRRVVFDLWRSVFIDNWDRLAPAIVVIRRTEGPAFLENFEMLACLAKQHSGLTSYPRDLPRIAPQDRWLAQDLAEPKS